MLRQTLIIALAAFGSLSMAQEPAAKFSFKSPAGPAKKVFEELSKVAGANLVASGPVADDVIVLNLSDVTLTETMDRIARTLHGEWRKEGSGLVFYRGSNYELADRRAEAAARVVEFRANLNRVLEEQRKMGAFNDSTAKKLVDMQNKMNEEMGRQMGGGPIRMTGDFGAVSQQTPAARAIATLLSRMSDSQIATLTSGNRSVFALNPTRMQMPMPNGANQVFQQFIRDIQTYRDVSKRNEPAPTNGERRIVINGFGADGAGDGDASLGIGYAMLIQQPGITGSNVSVMLLVADPNGKTIATGQFFVGGSFTPPKPNSVTTPANEKPLEFSPLAKELAKILNQQNGGGPVGTTSVRAVSAVLVGGSNATFTFSGAGEGRTPTLSPELKERVLNPDKYDPMSLAPGEAFTLASDAKGQDLVAYLPDPSFMSLNQIASGSVTPSTLLQAVKQAGAVDVVEDNGWMMVSPKSPASSRDRRVNRQALGNALRAMNSKGYLSLEDWAAFASKQSKAPRFNEVDVTYFHLINTPASDAGLSQFSFNGAWGALQFYASLSAAQRQALSQSGQIPIANLSTAQLGIVADQVFNSFDGPQVNMRRDPNSPGIPNPMFVGGMNAQTERTLVLPNGILRNGFLVMNSRTNEVVQANSTASGGGRFMNADTLAFERTRMERPELASFGPSTQYDQFRMASQRSFSFTFRFTPEISLTRQLEDNTPGQQPFVPYDRLPADFRKGVDQKVDQMKKSFGQGGGGGGQIPPP